ncbi:MAG: hypothetical protein U5L06_00945 [Rhodovibrio sp.]|nr:hypothetical protein [Rhodovibrio sp.]
MAGYDVETLAQKGAPILCEMLVKAARTRTTVTYRQVADEVAKRLKISKIFPTHVGNIAGQLMNDIHEQYPDAPLINGLVVRGPGLKRGLPGGRFGHFVHIHHGHGGNYDNLTAKQQATIMEPIWQNVFEDDRWEEIAAEVYGLNCAAPKHAPDRSSGEREGKSRRLGFGGPAESPEHKALKDHVFAHPRKCGGPPRIVYSDIEYRTKSWDEVDVIFFGENKIVVAEIKSRISVAGDLAKGVYQCIKYRAVIEAEMAVRMDSRPVLAVLVTEAPLPLEAQKAARKLQVKHINLGQHWDSEAT